ncbi:4Fe-4S binding protein [Clostridium sp. 19966]|uniref:4Fe-4S binding protein n=1 Tax=Clostridium sp. 19966 TaxID=2768166 RepID=UPI0028DE2479|nr:4Fe-4S binding protein [Clostridium sp. 19966]MDT8719730.1 4Fe-4S binding protein [Clostridium sp. 19966]
MNEEVLIICESIYHGNTRKLAIAMAKKLNCKVMTSERALSEDMQQYKVIGLASGIYFTSHHPKLFDVVEKMKNTQKAFIVSTHGRPFLGKYHERLKAALSNKGVHVIGEFSCRGYDCTGPYIIVGGGNKGKPNEGDQKRARRFIRVILPEYCKARDVLENGKNIEIHYEDCIGCNKCKTSCPMNVFDIENGKPIVRNQEDCIHCSICKEQCPSQAIVIQHSWREAIAIAKRHAKKTSL